MMETSGISPPSEVSDDGSESEASFVILGHGEEETANNEIHTDQEILETEMCDSEDVNVEQQTLENEVLEAIRQAGLDDKFWVQKIQGEFQIESLDQLKNVTEQQVIDFLDSTKDLIQTDLRQVIVNLVGLDINRTETKGPKASIGQSILLSGNIPRKKGLTQHMSAAEFVRYLENGVACRGVYLHRDSDESFEVKEKLIDVRDDLQFSESQSIYPVHQREFTSREAMQTFLNNICKSVCDSTTSLEKGISEIGLDNPTGCGSREDSFVGYVHYKLVPVVSVDLSVGLVDLRSEVIDTLQEVEQVLKVVGYTPSGHFDGFFEKYGSHLSNGIIDYGEVLISIATCERFEEHDYSKVTDAVKKSSERGIRLEANGIVQIGEPYRACDVFCEVHDIPSDLLRNITLTIKRIGRHEDVEEKTDLIAMTEDEVQLKAINKSTSLEPVWEILHNYPDKFQNHKELADTMKKEWNIGSRQKQKVCREEVIEHGKEVGSTRKEDEKKKAKLEEEKQKFSFREDIQKWIKEYSCSNLEIIEKGIRRLEMIRVKYEPTDKHWAREVLYLRRVQRSLIQTAKFIIKADREMQHLRDYTTEEKDLIDCRKKMIASLLRCVLNVEGGLQENRFPNLRLITETIEEIEGNREVEAFQIDNVDKLLEKWKDYKRYNNIDEDIPTHDMQLKLESTIKSMELHPQKTFEYLLFISLLQIFGFDTSFFRFGYQLLKRDLDNIFQRFGEHLEQFKTLSRELEMQAYIFKLALLNIENKEKSVLYLTDGLAGRLDKILRLEGNSNFERLHQKINKILKDRFKFDMESTIHSFQNQFQFLNKSQTVYVEQQKEDIEVVKSLTPLEERVIEAMGMMKYYPQKLSLEEVITLKSDVPNDVHKKPTSLSELPWYFVKHIIGLDSDTRENCHVMDSEEDSSDMSDEESNLKEEKEDKTIAHLHPLDLQKIIMLYADDFLRQELIDKMVRCQYAVPLILPITHNSTSKNLILLWAMKSLVRTYYCTDQEVTKPLVNVEAHLVTFMNIATETSWKSKLLNKMLSPQQETFWHQALEGGSTAQRFTEGMIEVAWWLPGRLGDNKFSCPVTFANLRGNASNSDTICCDLIPASSMTFVFVEGIDITLKEFLRKQRSLNTVVIIVLHKKQVGIKEEAKILRKEFQLEESQIICKEERDKNFNFIHQKIKATVDRTISADKQKISLTSLASKMRMNKNTIVDDGKCYQGQQAAKTILEDIDEYNKKGKLSAKSEILPFQSDQTSKQKLAWLEKEIYRQTERPEEKSEEDYWYEKKAEKEKLQLKQLKEPVSDTFKYFLQCILHLDEIDKKYFLQCLKLGLNERSEKILQPLYGKYEKYRLAKCTKELKEERDKKLKKLEEDLTHSSLGIEHFFREMGALYERILTLQEMVACPNQEMERLNELLNFLSDARAQLWLGGCALEIMDGDTIHIPVEWLKAVLKKVDQKSDLRIFKLCAVGAQGSGKSTLLNTTFGLNFPVSSGRCTRGAYMQLLKIDETLKEKLKCDYIAVIDSEGLMSRVKMGDSEFDNELATFVIGLSDLTLVVNKDEGSEMKDDVLPIAILVFLRMKPTGERKACHFVIEKRGAVGGMAQQGFEIDKFVNYLNEATSAAAQKADESNFKKFADVLQYDATKDNTYIPILYDGTEMGTTYPNHMRATEKLKSSVICHAEQLLNNGDAFNFYTLADTATRLEEIATAIKYEYVVLGFKSVLAVKSNEILAKISTDEQWEIKTRVRRMVKEEKNRIANEAIRSELQTNIRCQIQISSEKITDKINDEILTLRDNILHYFECGGCQKCNKDVNHRDQLVNNKKAFEDDVNNLQTLLYLEVHNSLENLALRIETEKNIHQLARRMDDTIRNKVQEVIKERKSDNLGKKDIEVIFDELWKKTSGDILNNAPKSKEDYNIQGDVRVILMKLLKAEGHLYNIMPPHEIRKKPKESHIYNEDPIKFTVLKRKHMVLRGITSRFTHHVLGIAALNEQDVHRLQVTSDSIIEVTCHHYDPSLHPQARQFNPSDAEELFKDVFNRIREINDEMFKTTNEYKMDLLQFIQKRAVSGFSEMHVKYRRESSPEALLEKKKKATYDLFEVRMLQGDFTTAFCHKVLKKIILKNTEEELECIDLLHMLKTHPGGMFNDVKSLQAWIMNELLDSEQHSNYLDYITNYEVFVKRMIKTEATKYLTEALQLQKHGSKKLENILTLIREALDEVLESNVEDKSFIKVLLSKLDTLTIPYKEIGGWIKPLDEVPEKSQFAWIIQQQLDGPMKNDIIKDIDAWNISMKLEELAFTDFVFKAVVGCAARCPFCRTPCDAHEGKKHSAYMHRPIGLGGCRYRETDLLSSKSCSACVCSDDLKFKHEHDKDKSILFKKYATMHPDWCIKPDADPDSGKYWKWVLAKFNTEFAHFYGATEADIPEQWTKYTKEEVREDLEYYLRSEIINPKLSSARGVSFIQRFKRKLTKFKEE